MAAGILPMALFRTYELAAWFVGLFAMGMAAAMIARHPRAMPGSEMPASSGSWPQSSWVVRPSR